MPTVRFACRFSTPELYRLVAAALVVLGLGGGVVGLVTERDRSSVAAGIVSVSGPLSVDAQESYRSLSDADATAATAFLTNGVEPGALRQRYLDDVARAGGALAVALRDANDEDAARLTVLADQLPIYTGLVETARSYNRLGVPLGGAYLREASGLMRGALLPAAQQLFESAQRRLVDEQREAAGFPWAVPLLFAVTIAALVAAQVLLARRTNRVFNVGLAAASLVALIALQWSTTALTVSADRVDTGRRDGSALAGLLADARRAALQARADEALTLIARGSGAAFEQDFGTVFTGLIGEDGNSGLLTQAASHAPTAADRAVIEEARDHARRWRELHREVRRLDDDGDYQGAVSLATGAGADSTSTVFGHLDTTMTSALATADERVERQADRGGSALGGLGVALVLLTGGLVTAVVLGFRPRIGEYR